MAGTNLRGGQIKDGSVQRVDLDVTTSGQSVIRKIAVTGSILSIVSSTGADSGTGDVTLTVSGPISIANGGTGQITAQAAINALTQVAGATNEYVLTKDTATGNALWKAPNSAGFVIGSIDGFTKSANGLVLDSGLLYAQTADASFPGLVSTSAQTFAGVKTLTNDLLFSSTNTGILKTTSDGSDNGSLSLGGGGGAAANRGGQVNIFGNEHASIGGVNIQTGDASGGVINLIVNSSAGLITHRFNGVNRWTWNDSGEQIFNATATVIRSDTSDGSDTKGLEINAGGAADSGSGNRGAFIRLFGNEHGASPGRVDIQSTTGNIFLLSRNGIIDFGTGTTTKWQINSSGQLTQDATNGGAVIIPRGSGNGIILGTSSIDSTISAVFGSPPFLVVGNNNTADAIVNVGTQANTIGGHFYGAKTRAGSSGTATSGLVSSGDSLAVFAGLGSDGVTFRNGGSVSIVAEGTPAANNMPARIEFATNSGAAGLLRRWYIDSAGRLVGDSTNAAEIVISQSNPNNGYTGIRANTATQFMAMSGTNAFTTSGPIVALDGSSGNAYLCSGNAAVNLRGNNSSSGATLVQILKDNGSAVLLFTNKSEIISRGDNNGGFDFVLRQVNNTQSTIIAGGSAAATANGALITVSGISSSGAGALTLSSGTSAAINLQIAGTTKWSVDTSGNIVPATDNAVDVGSASFRARKIYATQMATVQMTGALDMNSNLISNLSTPISGSDAATKAYVDAITFPMDVKNSVRVASTANITIASALINGSTIDGVTVSTGDRVLLKNQSTASENGIYIVAASGAASRSTDADSSAEVTPNMFVFIEEGSTQADTQWVLTTNAPITLGTTSLTFAQFGTAPGTGIQTLNSLATTSQTLVTGTSGTDFAISSSGSTHTFNIPDASGTARGLITTGAQTIAGNKTHTGNILFTNDNTYDIGSSGSAAARVFSVELDPQRIKFINTTNGDIYQNTSDAADNRRVRIGGGGDVTDTRGAFVEMLGNESTQNGSGGELYLNAGNVASGEIFFRTSGTLRWRVNPSGHLVPVTNNAVNIGTNTVNVGAVYTYQVGSGDSTNLILYTNNTTRWTLGATTGHLVPASDNTINIGSTTVRVSNLYVNNIGSGSSSQPVNLITNGTTRQSITDAEVQTVYNTITSKETNASVQTTNATITNLFTLTLADNTTYTFDVSISGRLSSTTSKGVGGKLRFTVYRNNAGTATLAADFGGALKELDSYGSSGYDFTVDVSSNDVRIRVTGAAAETVNWAANVRYVLVS